jgi:hypothetical protein
LTSSTSEAETGKKLEKLIKEMLHKSAGGSSASKLESQNDESIG